MTMANDGGKGSAPRPIPNREQFNNNWDAIFGKKKPEPATPAKDNSGE